MSYYPNIKRVQDETVDQYLVRLGDNLELYGLNWDSASQLLNAEVDEDYTESRWRKLYANYVYWKPLIIEQVSDGDEYIKEIQDQTIEFQKEKIRFQDQKREFNALIRQQARFEHLKDEIQNNVKYIIEQKPLKVVQKESYLGLNNKAISLWGDWHFGAKFSNSLNEYNEDIFKQRLETLLIKTIEYGKRHSISELTVANLGDAISGAIHVSTRVQSSEDVVKQIQLVAEYMAEALATLANTFDSIKFVNIIGNHSRLIANKTESIFRENLEYIIPWYLESRLKDFKNISISNDEDGMYVDNVEGESFVYLHGDMDHVTSMAKNLPQVLGIVPKYIFSGHIHHNTKEHGRTTVISNGSMMGVDDYAISKRFYSEPLQKMLILEGTRVECTYDIGF